MEQVPRGSGTIELAVVLRFVDIAVDALAEAREEIDALNVYPVPDGDTGTNMYLTVVAARDALREAAREHVGDDGGLLTGLAALRKGALLGARGNSGVILSQMLGAAATTIATAPAEERNASIMARALREATDGAYAAVGTPVEGTILTVVRAAAEAAETRAAEPGARARDVFTEAAAAAREALARTPEQLAVLRDAGVVDAGGRGLSVILDAAETVLTGRRPIAVTAPIGAHRIPVPTGEGHPRPQPRRAGVRGDVPARRRRRPAGRPQGVAGRPGRLARRGRRRRALERPRPRRRRRRGGRGRHHGRASAPDPGHPLRRAGRRGAAPARTTTRPGRQVVAVAAGPGLEKLFEEAGATVVVGGPGNRPSTGMILDAIHSCGAQEVIVLPNDADSVRAAQAAARTAEGDPATGVRVAVIPTEAQVQGLAALAVHEPGRAFDQDVLEMTATARHARHGAVTIAARQAMTMAGPCEPGDVLGVVAGDFAVVGSDLDAIAADVLERLLGGGGELVTIVAGEGGHDLARRTAEGVERRHPHVDVMVYDGGQERYPLLMSVE